MLKFVIIGQGSQTIQLTRELFSLEVKPDNLKVITINGDFNSSYIEFLSYYKIYYDICDRNNFNSKIHSLITDFSPDIVISFSNPFILSEEVLSLKTKFINFHPGILPNYKGNLSIVHSLINQEIFVGGTWHYIDKGIDTGNIIKVIKTPVKNFNVFTLNHKIFSLGIHCLDEIIEKVNNNYTGIPQKKLGNFYTNKFPNINELDINLQKRLLYFPPKFLLN
jgi:methionyl-tRNA formyltransferase